MNEKKRQYDQDYHRTHLKRFVFNLNIEKDKDVISYLERHKPMQSELKRLIREQIKKEQ